MKYRMIVPLFVICLFCFAFTSVPSQKQAGKGATSTVVDISGEYNPMCGERILVTGKLHIVQQAVTNKNKTRMTVIGNYQGVSGVGVETGKRYNITFSQKNVQTFDVSGNNTIAMSFTEKLISPGENVISFSVNSYYEFKGDGSLKAQDFDIVFCE